MNIFPASVGLLSVTKVLKANCICKTLRCIPVSSLRINNLFIKLANKGGNVCLSIDCSGFNPSGPGSFRTKAGNPDSQTCYFNVSNDNQMFNVFISAHINIGEGENKILFQIDGIKSTTNNETFGAKSELEKLAQNGATDGGRTQNGFGIFNSRGVKHVKRFRLRTNQKSARSKFLLWR